MAPEDVDSLRGLLYIGMALTGLLYVLVNWDEWRKPVPARVEQCKLHQRPLADCPPGSHDEAA